MNKLARAVTAKWRRTERRWTIWVCGGLSGCLALAVVSATQIYMAPSKPTSTQSDVVLRYPLQAYTADDDEVRTASILIPSRDDMCQHNLFDNYTGLIWTVGTTSCEFVRGRAEEKRNSTPERVRTIGKAFRSSP